MNKVLKTTGETATLTDLVAWKEDLRRKLVEYSAVTNYICEPINPEKLKLDDVSEKGLRDKFPDLTELDNER